MKKPTITEYTKDGVLDEKEYDKALTSYLDDERRIASETSKTNTLKDSEKEIEKRVAEKTKAKEEELKLSAEEKLAKREKEFSESMAKQKREFISSQIKTKYTSAVHEEEKMFNNVEIESFMKLVSDNDVDSNSEADKIINARIEQTKARNQKMLENTQNNHPNPKLNKGDDKNLGVGGLMAKKYSEASKTENVWETNTNKTEQ